MAPWIVYALLAALFAALVAILGKVGLRDVDATLATAGQGSRHGRVPCHRRARARQGSGVGDIPRRAFLFIVLSGAAGAASWFFYFLALRDGPATGVAALDRLSVVLVFILAVVFLGEAFSVKAALGALLVVAGAILLT